MTSARLGLPYLGVGVGLRDQHMNHILETRPEIDWFEAISENYLATQGWPRHAVKRIADSYPLVGHGVSLSIGSTDPLDRQYLALLKAWAEEVRAPWVSDHLCWTGVAGRTTHDLLPLPLNRATLCHVRDRVRVVQDVLEGPLVLENPSTYLQFRDSHIPEAEFLAQLAEEANCGLLLDVNNVYVSSINHGFDPEAYIRTIPPNRIVQFHLAGHSHEGTHVIDTHDAPVTAPVWELFRFAWERTEGASVLIEWDDKIPDFADLLEEARKARKYMSAEPEIAKNNRLRAAGLDVP